MDQTIALYGFFENHLHIKIDSEDLYNAIMDLSEKQRKVIAMSIVLDVPMNIVAEKI